MFYFISCRENKITLKENYIFFLNYYYRIVMADFPKISQTEKRKMHPNPVIQHIYNQIDLRHERQQQISLLVSKLIKEQHIQLGDGLYIHLGQTKRCSNTQAIQQWIQTIYDTIDTGDYQETYRKLEHEFLALMPELL